MAYLENEDANLAKHFENKRWLARFAYLVDTFNKLNMLNSSLQEKRTAYWILKMEYKDSKHALVCGIPSWLQENW
ncbi:hypothetical protein CesoFtcFv8_013264 [Champsocephalus esox]|uniref:Uncharacterized protein n=1 Tax=Champsocephalus esox TaxID=159716 RepID=A0AAN8BZ89_9TELE|nr:hypothetical protein CesoFtcFv8_013264 [Champsocephalus esox]